MSIEVGQDQNDRKASAVARGLAMLMGGYAFFVSLVALGVQAANPWLITLHPDQLDPIYALSVGHGAVAVLFLILASIVRRRGARRLLPRILLVLMPALLLLSVDRVLNVFWPPPVLPDNRVGVFVPHPRRGWTHEPLSQGLQDDVWTYIDRYGMRVTKPEWHRTLADAPRILFLGDSVTFGYNVTASACYVERVQAILKRRANESSFIAMNGGTISATPRQELDWLTHEGAAISPDLVVVQVCMNDITYMLHPAVLAEADKGRVTAAETSNSTHWSALMRLAFDWGRRQAYGDDLDKAAEFIATENFDRLLDKTQSESMWAAWDRATGDWNSMIAFCRSRKIPIAFMIVPLDLQIRDRDVSNEPQNRIRSFATRHDVPCLDLLPLLRTLHLDKSIPMPQIYSDYTHPSPNGHGIVARAIVEFLDENGLLKEAKSHWAKTHKP